MLATSADVIPVAESNAQWKRRVITFFTDSSDHRSEAVLERERYTFWHPSTGLFSRWYVVLPVILVQLANGALYSWSIFNSASDRVWGTPGLNSNAFLLGIAFFGLGTLCFGTWIERHGPFWSVLITLFVSPAGWGLACLGNYTQNLGVVYLFLFTGIGTSFAYISVTSCLQRWFSELKGFSTGIAVMGFGLGSFIVTTAGKALMDPAGPYNWPVYRVQGVLALTFFVSFAIALPFLRNPPPGYTPDTYKYLSERSPRGTFLRVFASKSKHVHQLDNDMTFTQALATQEFALLALMFFCVEITGIVFLSSAADMTQNTFGLSSDTANFVTSMLNLANFTGRVLFGFLSDKVGRKTFYLFSAGTQALAVGLMAVYISRGMFQGWLASFICIGALYGGGFGVIPATVSDCFGPKISAATHGIMISVWAAAAVIGIPCFNSITASSYRIDAAGHKVVLPDAYIRNALWLCGLPAIGFFALLWLNVRPRDRALRQAKHDWRARVLTWVLRVNLAQGGVRWMSPMAQLEEYDAFVAAQQQAAANSGGAAVTLVVDKDTDTHIVYNSLSVVAVGAAACGKPPPINVPPVLAEPLTPGAAVDTGSRASSVSAATGDYAASPIAIAHHPVAPPPPPTNRIDSSAAYSATTTTPSDTPAADDAAKSMRSELREDTPRESLQPVTADSESSHLDDHDDGLPDRRDGSARGLMRWLPPPPSPLMGSTCTDGTNAPL